MMSSKPQKISSSPKQKGNEEKIIDKIIQDLEDLCSKLVNLFQIENQTITNDSYELQKFCSKFEYLVQFKLKDKKSLLSSSNNLNGNKDYWNAFVSLLNNSRTFEDAIKYVKNLNEIKTSIGKGRAFIRFCLQYHRLADAIQQIYLEDKLLSNWYSENSVWFDLNKKSKIIQILYDLNDINFDIITKANYELDTSWPTINLSSNQNNNSNLNRTRTFSINSYSSTNTETNENLLNSTPLEMDDEIFNKLIEKEVDDREVDDIRSNMSQGNKKVSPESFYESNSNMEFYDQKMKDYELKLKELESHLNLTIDENRELNKVKNVNESLSNEIKNLNKKIHEMNNNNDSKSVLEKRDEELEELKSSLNEYRNKYSTLEMNYEKALNVLNQNEQENYSLKKEITSLKFELSVKTLNEENLIKDAVSQNHSLNNLKEMCFQQESTINRLKESLDLMKEKQQIEMNLQINEIQVLRQTIELKENENVLLNEQIFKLTKWLEEEKKLTKSLTMESTDQKSCISQLEMDNNEIKKRLVKLIKEKAELWQKADNLEYENLLKSTAMWQDDSTIHNCMKCASQFSFILRKHHCRVCLKIFCYYCCNDWIEYNNSKVRVCKKCFECPVFNKNGNLSENRGGKEVNDEDDDDPDINFEVRSTKLVNKSEDENSIKSRDSSKNRLNTEALKSENKNDFYLPENAVDDSDAFAIVSNNENSGDQSANND